jgi:uncharacterized protein (DUF2344 family)
MFLDFNTNMLFGNETQKLGPIALPDFTAKCPANNTKYIKAKHAHLMEQRFLTNKQNSRRYHKVIMCLPKD